MNDHRINIPQHPEPTELYANPKLMWVIRHGGKIIRVFATGVLTTFGWVAYNLGKTAGNYIYNSFYPRKKVTGYRKSNKKQEIWEPYAKTPIHKGLLKLKPKKYEYTSSAKKPTSSAGKPASSAKKPTSSAGKPKYKKLNYNTAMSDKKQEIWEPYAKTPAYHKKPHPQKNETPCTNCGNVETKTLPTTTGYHRFKKQPRYIDKQDTGYVKYY